MWLKIKVLLWKSLHLRKKHWISTTIELLLPCFIFYLMYCVKLLVDNGLPEDKKFINNFISSPISEQSLYDNFTLLHSKNGYFIYTPKTLETEQIMKLVAKKLDIPSNNMYAVNNESDMIQSFKNKLNNNGGLPFNNNSFGIVFEEIKKPHVFKYKIRNTNDVWKTDLLFSKEEISGPMNSGGEYFEKGFLALQLVLDKTFITISLSSLANSSTNINNYNLNIQSYTYAKYKKDSQFQELSKKFFPLLIIFSFFLMHSQTIRKVVEEKDSGAKELMKMMGLKSWMIWTGWIIHNLFVYVISITIVTYISCFEVHEGSGKLLNHTSPILFWIFFIIYLIAGIFFCFSISSLFDRPLISLMVGNMVWIFSYSVTYDVLKPSTHIIIKTLFMLFPNVALINAFRTILSLDSLGIGLQFSTLFTTGKTDNSFSVGFALCMLVADCFVFGFIAWYLDSVMPGKYGIAKPINFLFNWSKNQPKNELKMQVNKNNSKFFEQPPNGYTVGISIKNLHKRFGNINAVNGIDLDLYKGQITALLGHNGAGKTTTMSIITGLYSPSSGSVEFNNTDLFNNIDKFRENLGLCLQHNLLFPYLTTLDHLIFFGMLKGNTLEKSKSEGLHLLKVFNIMQKKDELVNCLSGGMRRKLSIAIALIGSPEILILDEPTSGMDPESRREMWDLLLSFRGTRTIIITTHFMEEADVLGDRIAIMNHGKIKCYGTSLFLKKAYGTGYNLTIINEKPCVKFEIIQEIKKIIPEAELRNSVPTQLIINLPNKTTNASSTLFEMLETNKKEFGIKGMSISCTTMEEVFLKAGENILDDDENNSQQLQRLPVSDFTETIKSYNIDGINLLKNQLIVLLEKNILCTYRRWFITLIFVFGSVLVGILTIKSTNTLINYSYIPSSLNISLSHYDDSNVCYRAGDNSSTNLKPVFVVLSKKNQATVKEIPSKNYIINDLLHMLNQDFFQYRTYLMIAGDFNQTNTTIIYNDIAIHIPAIAINLYTNALLQKLSGNNESYISTINEPIVLKKSNNCDPNLSTELVTIWFSIFTPGLLYLIGYFMILPSSERTSGIKQLQMMTRLSPITYWTASFIWDYFCYIVIVILTLVAMYLFDIHHVFTNIEELSVLLTLLLIFGWSGIFYAYVFSYFNKNIVGSILLFISVNSIIGLFINSGMFFMKNAVIVQNEIDPYHFWKISRHIMLIIPYFSYSSCIAGFIEITWKNKICKICASSTITDECRGTIGSKQNKYFEFASDENKFGILEETLFLFFSSIFFITIILLFDYKVFARLYQWFFNIIVGTDSRYNDDFEDSDVDNEKKKVIAAQTKSSNDGLFPTLLVNNLVKKFSSKCTSVRGVSFVVSPGECFGLLGVNGAGKTTIFRILTGDIFPSRGNAFIQTNKFHKLSSNVNKYELMIGYCPQFNVLNNQLTGRETLKLIAILRGIPPLNIKKHVDKWIKLMCLEEYEDKLCGNYSGGNKRKLNTAMALIGDPPVVFLDEPTNGVDPIARRNLWQLLAASQKRGQVVVLTSHSMDECEALCNRLAIIVDGVMKCIGNIQYLKNRYGQGFTVLVKLVNSDNTNISELKLDIERQFAPGVVLKDEHKELLHYHITKPRVKLSEIFSRMKAIKESYNVVEDYTVADTTLEQVFIAFAKRQAIVNVNEK